MGLIKNAGMRFVKKLGTRVFVASLLLSSPLIAAKLGAISSGAIPGTGFLGGFYNLAANIPLGIGSSIATLESALFWGGVVGVGALRAGLLRPIARGANYLLKKVPSWGRTAIVGVASALTVGASVTPLPRPAPSTIMASAPEASISDDLGSVARIITGQSPGSIDDARKKLGHALGRAEQNLKPLETEAQPYIDRTKDAAKKLGQQALDFLNDDSGDKDKKPARPATGAAPAPAPGGTR
jgi:hypothetical protein